MRFCLATVISALLLLEPVLAVKRDAATVFQRFKGPVVPKRARISIPERQKLERRASPYLNNETQSKLRLCDAAGF
jgi:hypothetical protein